MKRMLLIFSHSLTPEQEEEGERNLSVKEFVSLPNDLQSLWSQISPEGEIDEKAGFFYKMAQKSLRKERLSAIKSFSYCNLKYMTTMAREYKDESFVQQVVAQIQDVNNQLKGSQ